MIHERKDWLITGVVAVLVALFCHFFVLESYVVDGPSMEPTFHSEDHILVEKFTYSYGTPKRGDIVVFRYPKNPNRVFIKRVIALPGDRIEIQKGLVFVNGVPIHEPYLVGQTDGVYPTAVVPEGHTFVLGDNREISEDSRSSLVGFVPLENVQGRAFLRIYPFADLQWIPQGNTLVRKGVNTP